MKLQTQKRALSSVAFSMLLLTACEETDLQGLLFEDETHLCEQHLQVEAAISSLYKTIDNSLRDSTFRASDSAVVNGITVVRKGQVVTLHFNGNSSKNDGHTRSGSIDVTETGDYRMPGGTTAVNFNTYTYDGFKVTGSMSMTTHTSDSISLYVTGLALTDSLLTDASKTVLWQQGFNTQALMDDVYSVQGNAHTRYGFHSVDATTVLPMVIDNSCTYRLTQGKLELNFDMDTTATNASGIVDFIDNDGCENLAKITLKRGDMELVLARQINGF